MIFQEKYISCYIILTDQISSSGFLYFMRCWTIRVLMLFVSQAVFNLVFLIKLFFRYDQKVKTKIEIPWEGKELFVHHFKGLSLKQTRQIILEGEGPTLMNCISSDDKWKKLTKEKNMNYLRCCVFTSHSEVLLQISRH